MQYSKLLLAGSLLGFLSACTTTSNNAPVFDRAIDVQSSQSMKSVGEPASNEKVVDPRSIYVVKRGDTLLRIALDHGQSYADLVAWNNLTNPNDIKVDQVLRILPPDGSPSSQTSAVNLSNNIELKNLNPINPSTNKSGPLGSKRPFSDTNVAEMQKPDQGLSPSSVVAPIAESPKANDKPAESGAIGWMWPTEGKVVATFDDQKNKGIDIVGKLGQDIFASGSGKVMYEGSGIRGYGNLVIIKHNNNLLSAYAHNKINLVKEGQMIERGQKIAEMGNTDSDIVKLHFEIRQQGKPVDPSKFLPAK